MKIQKENCILLYIYFSVICSGAAIMIIEILAGKLLAPYFGSGIYVWTSIIAVSLFALSVGYYVAGRISNRIGSVLPIGMVFVFSGISIITSIQVFPRTIPLLGGSDLRLASLMSCLMLIFIPLVLLGTVSILAARLVCNNSNKLANNIGKLFSLSTISGIFGAMLAGFYLVSSVGSKDSMIVLSWTLLAVGICGVMGQRKRLYSTVTLIALMYSLSGFLMLGVVDIPGVNFEILEKKESYYGEILVLKDDFKKYLFINRILQTEEADMLDLFWQKGLLLSEGNYFELIPYLQKDGKKCLIIGLGGGLLAKLFSNYNWRVDAVEIDPLVVEVAKRYFNYSGGVRVSDGRYFLEKAENEYWDCIILDVFVGESVPAHMFTYEMFQVCNKRLTSDGILALNYIGSLDSRLTDYLVYTLRQVFPNVTVFSNKPLSKGIQFMYVFASKNTQGYPGFIELENGSVINLAKMKTINSVINTPVLITDDRNPVDVLRSQTAMLWRTMSMERFKF